jgi:hypothetical protein
MKDGKKRTETAAYKRGLQLIGVSDPCQLGGLQTLASDSMTDSRILDPSAGKFPAPAGERRHWTDKREYQTMASKASKNKNRGAHPRVDRAIEPTPRGQAHTQTRSAGPRLVKK